MGHASAQTGRVAPLLLTVGAIFRAGVVEDLIRCHTGLSPATLLLGETP